LSRRGQTKLFRVTWYERKASLCSLCRGYRMLCGKSVCPLVVKAKAMLELEKSFSSTTIFGSSPPAVFVGSWGYPRLLTGPLVPPMPETDTSVMDLPEMWLRKSFDEILRYRFSLIRGKRFIDVKSAGEPGRLLSTTQEIAMASRPTDVEVRFKKKPRFNILFSPREPTSCFSAYIDRATIAENPKIPRAVDRMVSDTDLKAELGVLELYNSNVPQRQIMRLFSVGLVGVRERRKLVPTEWSITAVDDIIGRALCSEILDNPWINEFMVFGHKALGNSVQVLLLPSSWMFEALEAWLISPDSVPANDYEFARGRRTYARNLGGAYYAVRLPVLEYLKRTRRQAGAVLFLEVYPEWIPIGVWRFREICREAMKHDSLKFDTLGDAVSELGKRLRLSVRSWIDKSVILRYFRTQRILEMFTDEGLRRSHTSAQKHPIKDVH